MLVVMDIDKVTRFLRSCESRDGRDWRVVYQRGNCGNFYQHMRLVFPTARAYISGTRGRTHIVVRIGDGFYDITGRLKPTDVDLKNFAPATPAQIVRNSDNYGIKATQGAEEFDAARLIRELEMARNRRIQKELIKVFKTT